MRGEAASFGVDLVLLLGGFGVLSAIGIRPGGLLSALGMAGLAYLAGSAVVPLALTLLLVVGIPFTLETFLVVVLLCVAVGIWRGWGSFTWRWDIGANRQGPWRSWPVDTWVIAAFVAAIAAFAVVGLLNALVEPMVSGDGWTIWARKAQILTEHDSLWSGFFHNPVYAFSHLDYPLQIPIFEAIHSRAAGAFEAPALLSHLWLLLVAFIWAMAYVAHALGRLRPVVWAPILLLVATAPGVWQQANGAVDLPMAMFACVGALAAAIWLRDDDFRVLALGAIMLAAAANTKNEGTAAAIAALVALGLMVLVRKLDWRAFTIAGGFVIVFGIVPWRLWLSHEHIKGDVRTGEVLHPSYLIHQFDRVWPTLKAIGGQLSEQGQWSYLVPLAAVFVLAALVSGLGRRIAVFYLVAFLLTLASFIFVYWVSTYELSWYLETSVSRTVTVLVLFCAAALVHLSGVFLASLGKPLVGSRSLDVDKASRSRSSDP
ncbi:MAG: hypothetical protein J0H06_11705 [Actinobacteria bacterium]|nr:hypothetical protein [Actinomycetota bacterium]